MMLAGGRSPRAIAASRTRVCEATWQESPPVSPPRTFPRSPRPSIWARPQQPYWAPVFKGFEFSRKGWIQEHKPDVAILVYNDHASAFSLRRSSRPSPRLRREFASADEGWGPRPVPVVRGNAEFRVRTSRNQLILDEFDMTIVNKMDVDHGLTVPLIAAVRRLKPEDQWPCEVIPLAVNVVQYPPPTGKRCFNLGRAIAQGRGVVSGGSAGDGLRHRRHVAPAAGHARGPDQPEVGQALSSTPSDPGSDQALTGFRTLSTCAKQARRASSW